MTAWTFQSGVSALGSSATAASTTGTITPNVGDLMIHSAINNQTLGHATGDTVTDTGSGGWNLIGSIFTGNGLFSGIAQWRIATATDHAGFTVTDTWTGGSGGTIISRSEVDVFRVIPLPYNAKIAVDLAGVHNNTSNVSSDSLIVNNTNAHANVGDELAWQAIGMSVSNGGFVLTQSFTNNFSTIQTTMAQCLTTNATLLGPWFVGGITPSAGAANANVFAMNWTTARANTIHFAATFSYLPTSGLLPILSRS